MLVNGGFRAPVSLPYNRENAVNYAHVWAFKRNPRYFDFEKFGGDCTNFASQVIYAGSRVMNHTAVYGWYYIDGIRRTASWTGVNFLHNFLVNNKGAGPFAERVDVREVKPGDIVQLSFQGGSHFDHSPVIVQTGITPAIENILIAAHTYDRDFYPLTNYSWKDIRFLHITGVRRPG
ncbi:MAG TPA: amidase domain-containing protein [Candidatus Nitrosocosmicus sp.]|nr:amidase domain-containing protein [Candidatus Nitrosocosmicus sp.]